MIFTYQKKISKYDKRANYEKSLTTGFLILILITISGCSNQDTNKLIVGMELQSPPFETSNAVGEPEGISVDLAYALGKYLGKEVEIQNIAWSD